MLKGIKGLCLAILVQCQLKKPFARDKVRELVNEAQKVNAFPLPCFKVNGKLEFEYAEV